MAFTLRLARNQNRFWRSENFFRESVQMEIWLRGRRKNITLPDAGYGMGLVFQDHDPPVRLEDLLKPILGRFLHRSSAPKTDVKSPLWQTPTTLPLSRPRMMSRAFRAYRETVINRFQRIGAALRPKLENLLGLQQHTTGMARLHFTLSGACGSIWTHRAKGLQRPWSKENSPGDGRRDRSN